MVTPISEQNCPQCNALLNRATPIEGDPNEKPQPGDIVICIRCSMALTCGKNLEFHPSTNAELAELSLEQLHSLRHAQLFLTAHRRTFSVN